MKNDQTPSSESPSLTCCASSDPYVEMRQRQNAQAREKARYLQSKGLCRCGKKAAQGVKMCPVCLAAARKATREAYRKKVGIPLDAPVSKKGRKPKVKVVEPTGRKPSTSFTKGVTRQSNIDGYGREDDCYVASMMINGKQMARRWSINKHGESGAKLAASLQKLLWVVENGLWNPEDGDPLAIMSYAESFSGNRDYDDCEISDVSSPWKQEYEDVA